jgi:hypothetical protein
MRFLQDAKKSAGSEKSPLQRSLPERTSRSMTFVSASEHFRDHKDHECAEDAAAREQVDERISDGADDRDHMKHVHDLSPKIGVF